MLSLRKTIVGSPNVRRDWLRHDDILRPERRQSLVQDDLFDLMNGLELGTPIAAVVPVPQQVEGAREIAEAGSPK
jgi:hypothetical protein